MSNIDKGQVIIRIVKRRKQDRVAYVTINNDKSLNSLNSDLMREFIQKVSKLADDKNLRVVVLTGAGERSFIGGANIFELRDLNPTSA